MTRPVYNLEFPSWCSEIMIFGYRFIRVDDYQQQVQSLQHLFNLTGEFQKNVNVGAHAITANVEIPKIEEQGMLEWSGDNNSALSDILLLLSLFTSRDVFIDKPQGKPYSNFGTFVADPRVYQFGGSLRASIPYEPRSIESEPFAYDIGFEKSINQIYELMRSDEWQQEYHQGYFLFLARMAFRHQPLESSFIQCWTIWEHLFALLNGNWLLDNQIRRLSSIEKISFLLVRYALRGEIDKNSMEQIKSLAEIRNRLIHFGRFPDRNKVHNDAVLFIRITEFVIAKTLGLSPSNVFNTMEKLEEFINNPQP